jgi:hypothetical protein
MKSNMHSLTVGDTSFDIRMNAAVLALAQMKGHGVTEHQLARLTTSGKALRLLHVALVAAGVTEPGGDGLVSLRTVIQWVDETPEEGTDAAAWCLEQYVEGLERFSAALADHCEPESDTP